MRKKRILCAGEFSQLATGYGTYSKEVLTRLFNTEKYEIAEFASYCFPNEPLSQQLMSRVPWTLYPAGHNSTQEEFNHYQSRPENQFGAWKFEETLLKFKPDIVWDVRDWWMCLAADTPIMTNEGVKDVVDIIEGDRVLTHTGSYRKVVKTMMRQHAGNMIRLTASHSTIPICLTGEHPVYAVKRGVEKHGMYLPDFSSVKPEWIRADELGKYDFVCVPVYNGDNGTRIDQRLARLIGYYAAEGCVMYEGPKDKGVIKGAQLTFGAKETEWVDDITHICESLFGITPTVKIVNESYVVVRIFSRYIGETLARYVPGLAGTKAFSPDLMLADKDTQSEILTGLFRGDGGTYIKRACYVTKSRSLAFQVFQMCLRQNILPSFGYHKNNIGDKQYHRYVFSFSANSKYNFDQLYKGNRGRKVCDRIANGLAFLTIKQLDRYETEEPVYNFEVERDNSYVSSFTLHNCEYQERSPFRRMYHWCVMPTVDSAPQNEQWIASFMDADRVLTYTDWGQEVLRAEGGGLIKLAGTASPGADTATFCPLDRAKLRSKYSFHDDIFIVGTIMRNQPRKLYPELMEAFVKFLAAAPADVAKKTFLYLHTSYPDKGWDIPRLIKTYGLGHKTLVTYKCRNCSHVFPSFFQDAKAACGSCKTRNAAMPSSRNGIDRATLAEILNLFDVYVQYANSEGFGMPQVEAASCGIPVMATDYSAMSDVVRKVGGYPIKVLHKVMDPDMGTYRAIPDGDHLVALLIKFFSKTQAERNRLGEKARAGVLKHYTWELATKSWERVFDSLPLRPLEETWDSPARLHTPQSPASEFPTNEDFVRWALTHILGRPDKIGSYMAARLIRDLNWGAKVNVTGGGNYHNEASFLGASQQFEDFDAGRAAVMLKAMCEHANSWERRRCGLEDK